jgi:hypothetical protein
VSSNKSHGAIIERNHSQRDRRVLELLANTGPRGVSETALIANEITTKMVAELFCAWAGAL